MVVTLTHFFFFTFSPKTKTALSSSLRRAATKFHFYPPPPATVACTRRAMEDQDLHSVTQDFKNHSLHGGRKLNLEDLNWDNSFVRELPPDPRTDSLPREVFY